MKKIIEYFSFHRRIARKLRRLQREAGRHNFTIADGLLGDVAKAFEEFEP